MTDKELIKEEIERRIKETYSTEGAIALKSLLDYINSISEEPVSEDLEEEIKSWIPAHIIGGDEYLRAVSTQWSEIVARHFAEWQKQQMMKDAVDGQVVYQIGSSVIAPTDIRYKIVSDRVYIPNVKLGDKVKIIIIKEEQQ